MTVKNLELANANEWNKSLSFYVQSIFYVKTLLLSPHFQNKIMSSQRIILKSILLFSFGFVYVSFSLSAINSMSTYYGESQMNVEEKDNSKHSDPNAQTRISHFKEVAKGFDPFTDKIGNSQGNGEGHRYHNMYGNFLLPLAASKPTFKLLEIGMGCNMSYGPGASVKLWKELFPDAELWEAEYNAKCVKKAIEKNELEGVNPLVGDQGNLDVLDSWIEQSGGKFDVIIDDGGHKNCQISRSFEKLWPELNPGGYYFIEDMHVGHEPAYKDCKGVVMGEMIRDWQQQLIFNEHIKKVPEKIKYPLPKDLIFVHCQAEACVLGKYHSEINDPYMPGGELS